jgi:hypothetical protein
MSSMVLSVGHLMIMKRFKTDRDGNLGTGT